MRFAEHVTPRRATLAGFAVLLGGWWGMSAIAEIDPRYYTPDPPRERAAPAPRADWMLGGTVEMPPVYAVPVTRNARQFDLGMRIPLAPRFVEEPPPAATEDDEAVCVDCGGPYEEPPESHPYDY